MRPRATPRRAFSRRRSNQHREAEEHSAEICTQRDQPRTTERLQVEALCGLLGTIQNPRPIAANSSPISITMMRMTSSPRSERATFYLNPRVGLIRLDAPDQAMIELRDFLP